MITNEEKQLLLVDLSARLPYGVMIHTIWNYLDSNGRILRRETDRPLGFHDLCDYWNCKPYLRPMSSMTEEELKEFRSFHCVYDLHPDFHPMMCNMPNLTNMFDWLNKHYIDYRGLISKSLALEALDDMYN